jgi:hypothetical protein
MTRLNCGTPLETRFWHNVNKTADCWEWTGKLDSHGYGYIMREGKMSLAHRIAWLFGHGCVPPRTVCVLHHCDNRKCVNPAHLFLGSRGDNNKDRARKGRSNPIRGKAHRWARITEEQARAIKNAFGTCAEISRVYGVSANHVHSIRKGLRWPHLS